MSEIAKNQSRKHGVPQHQNAPLLGILTSKMSRLADKGTQFLETMEEIVGEIHDSYNSISRDISKVTNHLTNATANAPGDDFTKTLRAINTRVSAMESMLIEIKQRLDAFTPLNVSRDAVDVSFLRTGIQSTTSPLMQSEVQSVPATFTGVTASEKDALRHLPGVGSVLLRKLWGAGIVSLNQVANPSTNDAVKLKAFSKLSEKHQWQSVAKELLDTIK